jgi:hypothetical protein
MLDCPYAPAGKQVALTCGKKSGLLRRHLLKILVPRASEPKTPTVCPKGNPEAMRIARAFAAVALLSVLAACAQPPQVDIDAARAALGAASRNSDVVTYAPDALRSAQEEMNALDAEIALQARRSALSRNYDSVAALARETADLAARAGTAAAAAKQQVASDAAGLVEEITAAIPGFESKVWAARRVPRIRLDIIMPLQIVPDQARTAVDDARKDIASGAFAAAKARLMAAKDQLSSSEETITEQTRIARSR